MGFWDAAERPDSEATDPKGSSGRGRFAAGTPDDVAALYTWANLQGARYRDFSASRRRYREQLRNQAEGAAAPEPQAIDRVPGPAAPGSTATMRVAGASSLEDRQRGGSAIRWAAGRLGWDSSSRSLGREPETRWYGQEYAELKTAPERTHVTSHAIENTEENPALCLPRSDSRAPAWGRRLEPLGLDELNDDPLYRGSAELREEGGRHYSEPDPEEIHRTVASTLRDLEMGLPRASGKVWIPEPREDDDLPGPAWLYGAPHEFVRSRISVETGFDRPGPDAPGVERTPDRPSLPKTEHHLPVAPEQRPAAPGAGRAPLLVLFSLGGGAGRTSLLATVGRALSASGERVLLGDAATYSLLPFYFGGDELQPGELRGFAPPEGSADAPILMMNQDLFGAAQYPKDQRHRVTEILRNGAECDRILLDIPLGSEWMLRRLATLQPTVLVPLMPDMSSVISLDAVERYFEQFDDEDGPLLPFYLLNQFDASQRLHRDVRERLRMRLGERLLSRVVRRSTAVSEALAEGMTVADYAPGSEVAQDYFDVAAWLRTCSPALTTTRMARSREG